MAASYGSGLPSPPQIGRPVDRVFDEAQSTGEIFLNGRKLRDYPKICSKYNLSDTTHVDVSRNRLTEVPAEFCDYLHVERINCYHNVIRSIPDAISQLQSLTHLNLSRNQLTVLTPALCMLGALEVLSASNNKLVSLPEEIGKMENLMDLDVSCNEISHLPLQIGDLPSLRCLNLRRNFLVELPVEISRLQLCRLDFSSNRIEKIPTVFRKMETLEQFILDHNPLSSPPAYICTKGRQHIMKFLHIEAIKEDRKRGIMINSDSDMKRYVRKSLPPQQSSEEMRNMLGAPESKWKRHTVLSNDSGYNSTGDLQERNSWQSGETQPILEENNNSGISSSQHKFANNQIPQTYYKNVQPYQHNNNKHWQNLEQKPQQAYSQNYNNANSHNRRSFDDSGPQHQVSAFAPQQVNQGNCSDSVRHEQFMSKPYTHHGYSGYHQHDHMQSQRLIQQHHQPYQENMSHDRHQTTADPPVQYPQHPQHSLHTPSSSYNQQRAAGAPSSNISHSNRAMAPSPSYSTGSNTYSNTNRPNDAQSALLNRSASPRGFHHSLQGSSVPVHSRQGSNSSFSSDISSTSRHTHSSYQQLARPVSVPVQDVSSSYLPPPPPHLIVSQGGSGYDNSRANPHHHHHHQLSPSILSGQDLPWADDVDLPPPPSPHPYVNEVAYQSPPPLHNRSDGGSSPPLTPPTPPMVITGNMEDEFTRELKRQKADYDRKKRQAEQIRVQQEEEEEREKEERRKAALKLQEEQRLLMEKQEEQKRQEELLKRQQEEERERIQEEERKKWEEEEAARKREEELQRLQEAVRIQAEEEKSKVILRNVPKQGEAKNSVEKNKPSNNYSNTYTNISHRSQNQQPHSQQQQQQTRPAQPPPPPPPSRLPQPPSSLPIHGSLAHPARNSASPSPSPSKLSHWQPQFQQHQQQQPPHHQNNRHHPKQQPAQKQDDYILTENDYRNTLSSQSLKEQQRLGSTGSNGSTRAPQQYRRAASDSLRKPSPLSSQVDSLNYINRNGVASDAKPRSRQSSTSTTPSVSPGPSPRNSISHLAKPTATTQGQGTGSASSTNRSPMGSQSHLAKPKSSVPRASANSTATTNGPASAAAPAQSQVVRRTKAAADRSNTSSPVTVRSARMAGPGSIARTQGSLTTPATSSLRQGSNSSVTDDESKAKKGMQSTETSRLKSRLVEPKHNTGLQPLGLKKTAQIDGIDNKRINTRPPTSTYGSGRGRAASNRQVEESNFTMKRREEHQREEAEQMDRLRQTVESRLRVTLPDNLAEALRDGVVLCHLANQIRPRSVGSIHVPSPAVPKLTLAKCRRNVDNFLDACRKIGVDMEQICGPQDIFDEKGITRVAITVAALVAIGTNPKQSAV
ncbi:leucine-rich repeat and calponin domain-containing protein [Plakobranchus ocellatus]|uniref:Leucine-rich repeat and calponin domain-containing protein n=1 Tax=Plakobranchus ocellatus TaxID=259542 RepID=A0AAV4E058_9GAST|nr:leucine-rich repeat and calponin domain-containing protein [Plakobranchus ocellatus]